MKDRSTAIDRLAGELDLSEDDLKAVRLDVESEGSRAELADAVYDLTRRRADIASAIVRGPWGEVKGGGTVALDASQRSQIRADVNDVDAEWLMRSLKLPYTVASRVAGKVRADWPGVEYLKATGDADVTLTPTSPRVVRSTMPLGGRLVVHGQDGRLDAQLVRLTAAGAEVAGRVGVTEDRRLSGQLTGRVGDIGRVTASLESFLGRARGSLLPTPVNGAVAIDARIAGTVDVPSATTAVKAPALKVGEAEGVALDADLVYTPAALSVRRADLTWEDAQAHVDGRVALSGDRRLALNVVADEVGVPWLLKVANQSDVPASGTLFAKGAIGGTTARPTAMIAVQGANLVVYEEALGSLSADVGLAGREIEVSRLVIEKPQPDHAGRISATGTYHLERRSYTLDLQSEGVRLLGLRLPGGERIRGGLQVAASGAGSVASPAGMADVTFESLEIERPAAMGLRSRLRVRWASSVSRRRREQDRRPSPHPPSASTSTRMPSSPWRGRGRRRSPFARRISTSRHCPACPRTGAMRVSFARRSRRPAIWSSPRRAWRRPRSSRSPARGTAGRSA